MNLAIENLLGEAMKLSVIDREEIAVRLMGSVALDSTEGAGIEKAWQKEISRRIAASNSGQSPAIPIDQAWPEISGEQA